MPPVTLEGDTLGQKRRHYNKLVEDAIVNKHYELCNISGDDSDIDNLLKIDIASKNRNVDYIIEVMKSKDLMYATTAIKRSTWLITDPQYANIINPEYVHTQLLPSMNTKIFNKLMLHVRLNLKDETRVESFYEYLKDKDTDSACKWLQNCSIPFIENVINTKRPIPLPVFKRLCEKSAHLIKYYRRVTPHVHDAKQGLLFMLKSHTTDVWNALTEDGEHYFPRLDKKKSEILMKTNPKRVIDDFETYIYNIDLAVVAKYMNKKEIKAFLNKQIKKESGYYLFYSEHLRYFIKNMPEEERFDFVKKTFIDKTEISDLSTEYAKNINNYQIKPYQWYEFAPFNVALPVIKKFIRKETSPSERCAMLSVLVTCARTNPQNITTLLKFVYEKHINEPFKFKIQFLNNLLSLIPTHEFDVETWNILDQMFHSMEVYTESDNNVEQCLESIVLYKVLHDEPVPKIVEQKLKFITFNTFKKVQKKLNQEQNDKLFTYLFNCILTKVQDKIIANEADFSATIFLFQNAEILIKDWKKDISNYPNILEKIQEFIALKQKNNWKTDLSGLYNLEKSWRKHMFEESLSLSLNEESCLNALKHKPQLLTLYDEQIDTLRTNDAVSLRRLLSKLRVYWPNSLAQHWTDAYLQNLNTLTGQKAVVKGLFMLLPQNKIVGIAKKHVPKDFKINWGETDQTEITIRKNIAKHLHIARPLITLDTVLWYAKGDYLQYAVPSLSAVLSTLSEVESREHIPKLLDAPVSLQKFGIHLAVSKLKSHEVKSIFTKIWTSSKNLTIRSVLFKHIHAHICKAKNASVEKDLWLILSTFIDNLTSEESAEIYKILGQIQNVPVSIRPEFYMKSYELLTSLPASANCEKYVRDLLEYGPRIIKSLDEEFIVNKMLSPAGEKFCSYECKVIEIYACYILCGNSEEDQLNRFKKVVEPALQEAFQKWNSIRSSNYYVQNNFQKFLDRLVWNFKVYYLTLNKRALPIKLFSEIQSKMKKGLPFIQNYVIHTSWKLMIQYVTAMEKVESTFTAFEPGSFAETSIGNCWMSREMDTVWRDIHSKISPSLGSAIVKCLKEDIDHYKFSTMHYLFSQAFERMFSDFCIYDNLMILQTLQPIMELDYEPSCIVVSKVTPKYCYSNPDRKIQSEIREKLKSHPSKAVRMHYYQDFNNVTEYNNLEDDNA